MTVIAIKLKCKLVNGAKNPDVSESFFEHAESCGFDYDKNGNVIAVVKTKNPEYYESFGVSVDVNKNSEIKDFKTVKNMFAVASGTSACEVTQ